MAKSAGFFRDDPRADPCAGRSLPRATTYRRDLPMTRLVKEYILGTATRFLGTSSTIFLLRRFVAITGFLINKVYECKVDIYIHTHFTKYSHERKSKQHFCWVTASDKKKHGWGRIPQFLGPFCIYSCWEFLK